LLAEKLEFLSPAWLDAVRALVEQFLADQDLAGMDFAISEELTDPPSDRTLTSAGTIGWYLSIRAGTIDVGDRPLDSADIRVVADYRTHHDLSCRTWAGSSEAMAISQALREQARADWRLQPEGDLSAAPQLIRDLVLALHDPIAAITR
jgi:hypothetical protein